MAENKKNIVIVLAILVVVFLFMQGTSTTRVSAGNKVAEVSVNFYDADGNKIITQSAAQSIVNLVPGVTHISFTITAKNAGTQPMEDVYIYRGKVCEGACSYASYVSSGDALMDAISNKGIGNSVDLAVNELKFLEQESAQIAVAQYEGKTMDFNIWIKGNFVGGNDVNAYATVKLEIKSETGATGELEVTITTLDGTQTCGACDNYCDGTTYYSSGSCNFETGQCQYGTINANSPTCGGGTQTVVFRTGIPFGAVPVQSTQVGADFDTWLAVDITDDGNLDGFGAYGRLPCDPIAGMINTGKTYSGFDIYYTSALTVVGLYPGCPTNGYGYSSTNPKASQAVLTSEPTEPYASNGQEVYG